MNEIKQTSFHIMKDVTKKEIQSETKSHDKNYKYNFFRRIKQIHFTLLIRKLEKYFAKAIGLRSLLSKTHNPFK